MKQDKSPGESFIPWLMANAWDDKSQELATGAIAAEIDRRFGGLIKAVDDFDEFDSPTSYMRVLKQLSKLTKGA